jgi:hypothetical protein
MKMVGVGDQHAHSFVYPADGVTLAGAGKLVLPEHSSRSSLFLQNNGTTNLFFGFGSARATCTILNGGVNTITVTNGGFNFTKPPRVAFYGGGVIPPQGIIPGNTGFVGAPGPGFPSPQDQANAHAVLTGNVVTSIVIDDPGVGYVSAPMVFLHNDMLDPNGCFDPSLAGGSGSVLYPGQSFSLNGPVCTTDQLAVFSATAGSAYSCWWTT